MALRTTLLAAYGTPLSNPHKPWIVLWITSNNID